MSKYYSAKRSRGLFDPDSKTPFKLSRSKIEFYMNCPRCFYIDRRLGVAQPPGFPFNLNSAVDKLLKKEFDIHRAAGTPHPWMEEAGLDAVPFSHSKLDTWRDPFRGIEILHEASGFHVFGGVDDVWVRPNGELIIVDYKATSKDGNVSIDAEWQIAYKRQMEIYQWLFRRNGFSVSDTGYFVYCNGDASKERFDSRLEFKVSLLPYTGSDKWLDKTLVAISECLKSDDIPEMGKECDFCDYRTAFHELKKKRQTVPQSVAASPQN